MFIYIIQEIDDIHAERANTELARKSLRFSIAHVINNTPALIIDTIKSHSLQGFSSYAKNFFSVTI